MSDFYTNPGPTSYSDTASTEDTHLANVRYIIYSPGWGKEYPRLQILSIADLLDRAEVKCLYNMEHSKRHYIFSQRNQKLNKWNSRFNSVLSHIYTPEKYF